MSLLVQYIKDAPPSEFTEIAVKGLGDGAEDR